MTKSSDEFWSAPITVTLTRQQWQCIFASLSVAFNRTVYEPDDIKALLEKKVAEVRAA